MFCCFVLFHVAAQDLQIASLCQNGSCVSHSVRIDRVYVAAWSITVHHSSTWHNYDGAYVILCGFRSYYRPHRFSPPVWYMELYMCQDIYCFRRISPQYLSDSLKVRGKGWVIIVLKTVHYLRYISHTRRFECYLYSGLQVTVIITAFYYFF